MALPQDPQFSDEDFSESDAASDYDSDNESAEKQPIFRMLDKDSDEEDLELLVFGNKAGFRENLLKSDLDASRNAKGKELQIVEDVAGLEDVDDADLFMIDTGPASGVPRSANPTEKTEKGNAPVWEDSDDDRLGISLAGATRLRKLRLTEVEDIVSGTEYSRRLRQQYLRLNPAPAWARDADARPVKRRRRSSASSGSSGESGSESDSDVSAQPLEKFLRDINSLAGRGGSTKRRLKPEVLNIQKTRDIPDKHRAPVECLSFHPEYPVLLSASAASVLQLHHIAPGAQPIANPLLTSVQIKGVDVRRAEFLYPQGDKIFIGGRRKYFHNWDLKSGLVQKTTNIHGHRLEHKTMEKFKLSPCGRYMGIVGSTRKGGGVINLINVVTVQWIASARLSSRHGVADFAWWSNGEGLTMLGRDGQVGEFSMQEKKFLGLWRDDGCIGGIAIGLGGHQGPAAIGEDRWVAVGSNSGITNIYDRNNLIVPGEELTIKENPTPTRIFEQLVTPVTVLAFSPDGQLFAFGSREKKDALRLVHLPTCTVYRNWPTSQTPLGRITTVAFGRTSEILAVGNDSGKIRLWEIRT